MAPAIRVKDTLRAVKWDILAEEVVLARCQARQFGVSDTYK